MNHNAKVISQVKILVRKKLGGGEPGHDYWHCHRVVQNALAIGKKEKANLLALELAGWLHDIAINSEKPNHEEKGAKIATRFLTKLGMDKEIVGQIASCIRKHRFSKNKKATTLEEKILQDADKLDALGAVGIARVFLVAGKYRQILHDPKVKPSFAFYLREGRSNTTINHFYDKLFKLRSMLHTKTARKMAESREQCMREFLKRFYLEWEGKK